MQRYFIVLAGAFLAVAGAAKFVSVLKNSVAFTELDSLFGIRVSLLMVLAGAMELVLAGVCLLARDKFFSVRLVAWLATGLCVYRTGGWILDKTSHCSCLGNWEHLPNAFQQHLDNLMKVILAYLLLGSYGLLIWQRRTKSKAKSTAHSGDRLRLHL